MELKILAVGLLILFLVPPIQGAIVTSSTSTSQPLAPITQTQLKVHTVTPGQFAQDLGSNTMQTTPKAFSFYRPGGNFSIGAVALTVNGQSIGLSNPNGGLFPQGLFNSTTTEYLYDQTVAIFPNMYHAHLELYLNHISGTYNWEMILKGSGDVNGFPMNPNSPLQIQFLNPESLQMSQCNSLASNQTIGGRVIKVGPCLSQQFGNMGIDWSKSPYPTSYNNATLTLTYTVPSSFLIDPLALDGSANSGCNACASVSASLTTATTNDIIIAEFNIFDEGTHNFGTISDGASLTWTLRAKQCAGSGSDPCTGITKLFEYYAKSSGTLSGDSITVTTASNTFITLEVWGVSGADFTNPFDTNAGLPAKNHSPAGASASSNQAITFSTSNAKDFLMVMAGDDNLATGSYTADTSYTIIQSVIAANRVSTGSEYQVVSATQSGVTENLPTPYPATVVDWVIIADAIVQAAGVTQPIIITTLAAGAPSATISISGCAVSNSTFTANGFKHTYSSVTPSCTITLTEPADGSNTRYRFNISPKPTAATSITFQTCASGTCSTYSNSTYYQVNNVYHATPLNPSTWDGAYSWLLTGFTVGTQVTQGCTGTVNGGGVVNCAAADGRFYDYGQTVAFSSPIGNTWIAQAPSSFTDTTGGNTDNVNYVQNLGSTQPNIYGLLAIGAAFLVFMIVLAARRRSSGAS